MEIQEFKSIIGNRSFIKKVQYVLIVLFLLVVALDVYLALDKEDNNTISNVIQNNTDDGLFILTYLWGAVAANLFFIRFKKPFISNTLGSVIVVFFALLIAIFNIESKVSNFMLIQEYDFSIYFLSMAFGTAMGLLFWQQYEPKLNLKEKNKKIDLNS